MLIALFPFHPHPFAQLLVPFRKEISTSLAQLSGNLIRRCHLPAANVPEAKEGCQAVGRCYSCLPANLNPESRSTFLLHQLIHFCDSYSGWESESKEPDNRFQGVDPKKNKVQDASMSRIIQCHWCAYWTTGPKQRSVEEDLVAFKVLLTWFKMLRFGVHWFMYFLPPTRTHHVPMSELTRSNCSQVFVPRDRWLGSPLPPSQSNCSDERSNQCWLRPAPLGVGVRLTAVIRKHTLKILKISFSRVMKVAGGTAAKQLDWRKLAQHGPTFAKVPMVISWAVTSSCNWPWQQWTMSKVDFQRFEHAAARHRSRRW